MKHQRITPYEWHIAHYYLDHAEDGTKLSFTHIRGFAGKKIRAKKFESGLVAYETYHSFIKLNGNIFAVAQGKLSDAQLPHGRMSNTKYAYDELGHLYILKISRGDDFRQESKKLVDTGLAKGYAKRKDSAKHYIALEYVGQDVKQYLQKHHNQLTDEQRLEIACQLGLALFNLHTGFSSQKKIPYAHLDLKADNMTIDKNLKAHVIDLGMSEKEPNERALLHSGATYYQPYHYNQFNLSKADCDIFALKRILYRPNSFYGNSGYEKSGKIDKRNNRKNSILTKEILQRYNLRDLVDTSSASELDVPQYDKKDFQLHIILASLINARYKLNIPLNAFETQPMLAYAIIYCYQNNKMDDIQVILSDVAKYRLIGALTKLAQQGEIDTHLQDETLLEKLSSAETEMQIMAILQLKTLNKPQYYDLVLVSPVAAQLIDVLKQSNKLSEMDNYLTDDMLSLLTQCEEQELFFRWIANEALGHQDIYGMLCNPEYVSEILSSYKNIPFDQLFRINETKYQMKAIQCPDMIRAIQNIISSDSERKFLYALISRFSLLSNDSFKIINMLFEQHILTDKLLGDILYGMVDEEKKNAILLLAEHNLLALVTHDNLFYLDKLVRLVDELTPEMVADKEFIALLKILLIKSEITLACKIYRVNPELSKEQIRLLVHDHYLPEAFKKIETVMQDDSTHSKSLYDILLQHPEFSKILAYFTDDLNYEDLLYLFNHVDLIMQYKQKIGLNKNTAYGFIFCMENQVDIESKTASDFEFIGEILSKEVDKDVLIDAIKNEIDLSGCINLDRIEPVTPVLNIMLRAKAFNMRDDHVDRYLRNYPGARYLFGEIHQNPHYMQAVCDLYQAIETLSFQRNFLEEGSDAAQSLDRIMQQLDDIISDDFRQKIGSDNPLQTFKTRVERIIVEERESLAHHGNFLDVLDKLLTALVSLVVFYPLTRHVMASHHRYNLFFKTDGEKCAEKIAEKLSIVCSA